jgi:uncharacterized membrane protein
VKEEGRLLEILIVILIAAVLLVVPLVALVLAIVAVVRSGRIRQLEARIRGLESQLASRYEPPTPGPAEVPEPPEVEVELVEAEPEAAVLPDGESRRTAFNWELLIGQKAFGWMAVVLAFFSAAFFLKYAYDNNWIGPQGRVAVGALFGLALMVAGLRYFLSGWRVFSQMLSSCGVVVLYLATYSAFGFYDLLPSWQAGIFLAIIIGMSMVAAVLYDAAAIAFVAVLGGLLTPILLATDHDAFQSLFTYLATLNLGVAIVTYFRPWPALGSTALVGTQVLFWMWYARNYHPEKLAWVLAFQAVIYALYLAQDLGVQFRRLRGSSLESAARMLANAAFWFSALFILLNEDYEPWMGAAALTMASVYAAIARLLLLGRRQFTIELLAAVALSVSFLTLAIPLEADARWVALGWAACGAALWWFGVRVNAAPLRGLAAALAVVSLVRLVVFDLTAYPDELVVPIFNTVALPSLGVIACLLGALVATERFPRRLADVERILAGLTGLGILVVLWLALSVDVYHQFEMRDRLDIDSSVDWDRLAQMSLSVLWTVYATVLLAIGLRWQVAPLRWLAIGVYAITVGKVFLLDMAGLRELYRIIAFFVLAVFLGLAARVYQRMGRGGDAARSEETTTHVAP